MSASRVLPELGARYADDSEDQYANGFAGRWDELVDWDRREALEADFLEEVLQLPAGSRVLDLACGTGFHTALLADRGHRVSGIDGSAEMIATARHNLSSHGSVDLRQLTWSNIHELGGVHFDAVICLGSSLPHASAPERRALLAGVRKLLRPGGRIVVDHRNFDHLLDHGSLPGGASVYGDTVEVSLRASDPSTTTFGYRYADGFERVLTVNTVRLATMRGELGEAGFVDLATWGDRRPVVSADSSAFFLHAASAPSGETGAA